MKLLFAQRDVIGKIGGGEAASARLFRRTSGLQVTWLQTKGPVPPPDQNFEFALIDADFSEFMRRQLHGVPLDERSIDHHDFCEAELIAHAVQGRHFDIVECPDYLTYGRFLPFALAEHRVRYSKLVCSLHGRLSRTFEVENQFRQVVLPARLEQIRMAERQFTFGSADLRYGFSERYAAQTRALCDLPVQLVDPFSALPEICRLPGASKPRDKTWFVGRQDRIKGSDLFLAAVFRAGEELWQSYAMCGPSVNLGKRPSVIEAMQYCNFRGMPFNYRGPLPHAEVVRQVYERGAVVVISSREDTFNLVALEALLSGVPVLLSKHAGAADFVWKHFGADFAGAVEFDPLDELAAGRALKEMWQSRRERANAVAQTLKRVDVTPQPHLLTNAYTCAPTFDIELRAQAQRAWEGMSRFARHPQRGGESTSSSTPAEATTKRTVSTPPRFSVRALLGKVNRELPQSPSFATESAAHLKELAVTCTHLNRARIYLALADLEESQRPAVAAAYRLRAFRMNALSMEDTNSLAETLKRLGFSLEAKALHLWASDSCGTGQHVREFLNQRETELRSVSFEDPEYMIDNRDAMRPRISVIVSMYNVAKPVFDNFIAHLCAIADVRDRRVEIIFIDSGSSEPQQRLLEATPAVKGLSHAVIRSRKRETIQTAWNRGVQASRGEYLGCLGVDEGVTEMAFTDLADFLDSHPTVDWVAGNAVVTEVDHHGLWRRDVMSYARTPYSKFSYFGDCTYLTYVGSLYRRSVHTRFGWYDGAFKGAGDTEFKCRMMGHIGTASLPRTYGVFFDFPTERMTNSANIEIEDFRAWYLFRGRGGIEYLLQDSDISAWEELFWSALSSRRCWARGSTECDLPFAANILRGLLERQPQHSLSRLMRSLHAIVKDLQALQMWDRAPWLGAIVEADLRDRTQRFFARCAKLRPDLSFACDYRADATFFSHSWTW